MDADRLISEAANRSFVENQATRGHSLRYVEPATMIDVMFDQLEYLLAHESKDCPSGCKDCSRLRQVEDWLLQPFRDTGGRKPSPLGAVRHADCAPVSECL
jgi:hypothetical protein